MSGDHDDAVGYGKPPKATRFRKGQSGNPSGRPKRRKTSLELLRKEMSAKVEITEGGRRRRVTKAELIAKQFVNRAVKGEPAALRMMASLQLLLDADLNRRGEAEIPLKERLLVDASLIEVIASMAAAADAES